MSESPHNILARLDELRMWQEQQQEILVQKQIAQREILSKEQQKMYELFGLSASKSTITEGSQTLNEESILRKEYEKVFDDDDDEECNLVHDPGDMKSFEEGLQPLSLLTDSEDSDVPIPLDKHSIDKNAPPNETETESGPMKPKRKFLKRGEGLSNRFKIHPDNLKLDRLPKYKFANVHKNKFATKIKPSSDSIEIASKEISKPKIPALHNLNLKRVETGNIEISRPIKTSAVKNSPRENSDNLLDKYLKSNSELIENVTRDTKSIIDKVKSAQMEHLFVDTKPEMLWSKVLEPENITPVTIRNNLPPSSFHDLGDSAKKRVLKQQKELDDLNIFELLENKVNNSSFNGNTSSILKILDGNGPKENVHEEEASIIIDTKKIELKPHPFDTRRKFLIDETTTDEDDDNDGDESHHVRFVDKVVVNEIYDDFDEDVGVEVLSETETVLSNDLDDVVFNRISTPNDKQRFQIENNKQHLEETDGEQTLLNIEASKDLLEKSELLKTRLLELEKEIESFRQQNALLTKMKQAFEMEKLQLEQQREDMDEKLNDERIQMEVYLHDERIKIEDAKKNYEKLFKELQKPNRKDKEEVVKLKDKVLELQNELKAKEIKHGSAQARLRSQNKNLEKEVREQQLEIDVMRKENKKLETENSRLRRQHSNKILHEINTNIAKLAPKIEDSVKEVLVKNSSRLSQTTAAAKSKPVTKSKSAPNLCDAKKENELILESSEESAESEDESVSRSTGYFNSSHNPSTSTSGSSKTTELLGDAIEIKPKSNFHPEVKETNREANQCSKENIRSNSKNKSNDSDEFNFHTKREILNDDGSRDIWYKNGNIKKITPDGLIIRMLYFNKDIKETNLNEGTIKYYYAETNTWHTSYLDGLEILEFPNGQTEHRYKDGTVEVHYPNGSIRIMNPNKKDVVEEWKYNDGTNVCLHKNGEKILTLTNGQREIHTKLHKRREYPDGTVKILYPDGSQETRYSNGRVRLKDNEGNLISDSESNFRSPTPQSKYLTRS